AEYRVAGDRVGDEARVQAADLEIRLVQRLLDFIHHEAEETRLLEHLGQQRTPGRAADGDEGIERRADAVPAGDEMPVLAPGEHPRDGAQVRQFLGAEAAGGAR